MGILATRDPLLTSWTMLLKALTLRNVSLIVDFNPIDFILQPIIWFCFLWSYEYYEITVEDLKKYGPGPAQILAIANGVYLCSIINNTHWISKLYKCSIASRYSNNSKCPFAIEIPSYWLFDSDFGWTVAHHRPLAQGGEPSSRSYSPLSTSRK